MMSMLVSAVTWPPGYYIWRDRVPFFLSIIYLYKHRVPKHIITTLGWYLTAVTTFSVGMALGLHLKGFDMQHLAGIHWSAPSPIEWGSLIVAITGIFYNREIPIFESFYLAFITAMGGGWLYEFTPLLFQGNFNYFVFFKINAVKVFFMEFQLLCIPILVYLIKNRYRYTANRFLAPTGAILLLFSALNKYVIQWVQTNLIHSYKWYVRLPAILFLFTLAYGIKGETLLE